MNLVTPSWLIGTVISGLALIFIILELYRSWQSPSPKPGRLSKFIKRHAFFLLFFFGSLAITGEFSLNLNGTSIVVGLLFDLAHRYIKTH
jgi:cytochrome b561